MIQQDNLLSELALSYGIQPEWIDIFGNTHKVPEKTFQSLLSSMDVPTHSSEEMLRELETRRSPTSSRRWVDSVMVRSEESLHYHGLHFNINWPEHFKKPFEWTLHIEGQSIPLSGTIAKEQCHPVDGSGQLFSFGIPNPANIPQGYHQFILSSSESAQRDNMRIIISPTRCYRPASMGENAKVWGPSVQLYALHSNQNWGIGNFTDLNKLAGWCANTGASLVGVNPLHALYPHSPEHCSPYSPSSRMYINMLNLDVEAIEDFKESDTVRRQFGSKAFQEELTRARQEELVNYSLVASLKLPILKQLYQHFEIQHLQKNTERAELFKAFVTSQGKPLQQFSLFHALQQHFFDQDASVWGWQAWPEAYQNPEGEAAQGFLKNHYNAVEFYMYLQWQIDCQLRVVGNTCLNGNMPIGLYMDMAVGVDRGGADVWANQELFMESSSVGAPPDEYNPMGQDWGLPPLIPERLRRQQYDYFIQMIQQSMRHAGALRIDHIMGIMRLFLIPPDSSPEQGAYMHYPMDEMLGILALESQRNQCLIIGEDMGTVADLVRERMQAMDIFSYKVFCFEKLGKTFKQPDEYHQDAVIAISTHDMPTWQGYWEGRDLAVRTALNLYPTEELKHNHRQERIDDRIALLYRLRDHGLLPEGIEINHDPAHLPPMTPDLMVAFHKLVAKSATKIFTIQLEDVLHQSEQINLPGVSNPVYPCWKRKLTQPLETLLHDERLKNLTNAIQQYRGA